MPDDREPLLTLLASTEVFGGLPDEDLRRVLDLCEARALPGGVPLCAEGDPGDALFIVISGELRAQVTSQGGERVLLGELGPGSVVGEVAVLDGGPRSADLSTSGPTALLSLRREPFLSLLDRSPRMARRVAEVLARRLRASATLVREIAPLSHDPGASGAGGRARFDLTQVGYGRYGNRYVGPKYAKRGHLWEPRAVVDPGVHPDVFAASVLAQARPDVQLFATLDQWRAHHLDRVPPERRARQVVELALKPELVLSETLAVLDAGVRMLILPKPVVMDAAQLDELTARVAALGARAAVASQWYYSDVPRFLAGVIQQRARASGGVLRVDMDFSKENGLAYETPPALLELPHVLQLLDGLGLVDFTRDAPEVRGGPTRVEVRYQPPGVPGGVHLACDTDLRPSPELKRRTPRWDVQVRTLAVTFADAPERPGLRADFWVKFDRSGDFALRPGRIVLDDPRQHGPEPVALRFVDDQLMVASERMFAAFTLPPERFEASGAALSLARYGPVGRQLMRIQADWEAAARRDFNLS